MTADEARTSVGDGPVVSVVTVVFNDAAALERTIGSVRSQRGARIEYIVVDGGSDDGTVGVIESHGAVIDRWLSEPDEGIYDAMNKGVRLATGDWVCFMNAGDRFVDETSVADAMARSGEADVVYGASFYAVEGVHQLMPTRPLERIWQGMPSSHQAMFVRRADLLAHPFDTGLAIAADFECVLWLHAQGRRFVDTGRVLAVLESSGVSRTARIETSLEQARIAARYFPSDRVWAHYRRKIRRERLKSLLRIGLPGQWIARCKNVRHRLGGR